MIQRKQSLYVLAVFLIATILIVIPVVTFTTPLEVIKICLSPLNHSDSVNSSIYLPMVLNFLVILISIVTLFQYKNRLLQYKLANLLTLLNVGVMGLIFFLSYIKEGVAGSVSYTIGSFLPVISLVFSFFAAKAIHKDEQMVRNSDRIR